MTLDDQLLHSCIIIKWAYVAKLSFKSLTIVNFYY